MNLYSAMNLYRAIVCAHPFTSMAVIVVGCLIYQVAITRRDHNRVLPLLDLFDSGTGEMDGDDTVRGYYFRPYVVGLFHGRPARISTRRGFTGNIRISVRGHFRSQFEILPDRRRPIRLIRASLIPLFLGIYFVSFLFNTNRLFIPEIPAWKFIAAVILSIVALRLVIDCHYKLMGYDKVPDNLKPTRGQILLPGLGSAEYKTRGPSEFGALLDRPEAQNSFAHLITARKVECLRAPSHKPFPWRFREWEGAIEAECLYRKKLVDRDAVRDILMELSIVCESIEQIAQPSEPQRATPTPKEEFSVAVA